MSFDSDRWPSQIPGEALPPSVKDIGIIEEIAYSCQRHGDEFNLKSTWMECYVPIQQAVQDPDIRRLRGLLNDGRFPPTCISGDDLCHMPWNSALNMAIARQLPAHARLLVETGAEVNGFPLSYFRRAASRFARIRSPELTDASFFALESATHMLISATTADTGTILQPLEHRLTASELGLRRTSRSRFWAESDFPRFDFPAPSPRSSLAAAAAAGDSDTYEFLIMSGADESAWRKQFSGLQHPMTTSMLTAESPLQVAAAARNASMVTFLLSRQHKPDIFPVSMPTRALSPLMLNITSSVPWKEGLALMLPHSDVELRTPTFGIHLLHLAVATLETSLVGEIQAARKAEASLNIACSALGHSLLHIACLPLDNTFVNMAAEPIAASAREFRTLAAEWRSQGFHVRRPVGHTQRDRRACPCSTDEMKYQAAMIKHLLPWLSDAETEFARVDVHGNTPLHYLAMMRYIEVYTKLICSLVALARGDTRMTLAPEDLLVSLEDGQGQISSKDTWTGAVNHWSFTPQQLYQSNVQVGDDQAEKYNIIQFWNDEERHRIPHRYVG